MADADTFYHAAFVVPDLDAAMVDWGEALALTWARVQRRTVRVQTQSGVISSELAVTYSIQGPPYWELFQVQPAPSPWSRLGMHHVGAWTEDLQGQLDRLLAIGFVREFAGVNDSGDLVGFQYLTDPSGNRIEVLYRPTAEPMLQHWIAGGDYT